MSEGPWPRATCALAERGGDEADQGSRARRGGLSLAEPALRRARQVRALQRLLFRMMVTLCLVLAVAVIALAAARLTLRRLESSTQGRIYPRVYALDVALGGLTGAEAQAALATRVALKGPGEIILRDGERRWAAPGPELGVHYDVGAVVEAAMAVGRSSGSWPARLSAWMRREDVAPLWAVEAGTARTALSTLVAEVSSPPKEAVFALQGEQLIAVPGEMGRALDVEATLASLESAVRSRGAAEIDLVFRPIAPRVVDARPALAQAEAALKRPLTLTAYDIPADEDLAWALPRAAIASWLRPMVADGRSDLAVAADGQAVRATLARLAGELGGGRGFRLDEATDQVLRAFNAGGGTVRLYLTHPQRSHVVELGETLDGIALDYGLPPALLAAANPTVAPDGLSAGQTLRVPSVDVLLPYLPVQGKRIVVSVDEQRVCVYENGALRWDWPCSTGAAATPTPRGSFEVLAKVELAYASTWWMPHFLSLFPAGSGPDNGIHGLPVSADGTRLWAGYVGLPVSFGTVILGAEEAEMLYEWAQVGVPVVIQ